MRAGFVAAIAAALLFATAPATAEPPDEAFSKAHVEYMTAKAGEFLAPITSAGTQPTSAQLTDAWCRAAYFWKMANPGGEAKLTMKVLLQFRRLQWMCGQKIKRAPPLPEENDEDGTPPPPPPTDSDPNDESQGGDGAVEDFLRWHPEEFTDAPTETEYVQRRIFWWEWIGEGGYLLGQATGNYEAMGEALKDRELERRMAAEAYEKMLADMQKATDEANRAYEEARAAEIEKARREWAEKHPDKPRDFDGTLGDPVPAGQGAGRTWRGENSTPLVYTGRGGEGSYPVELERLPPDKQREIMEWERRTAAGSVDPLDAAADRSAAGSVDPLSPAWAQAVQPVVVGPNSQVGSGARVRDQVVGALAGALGVRGGDGDGPKVENCRFDPDEMQAFGDPQSGVSMKVAARRNGDAVTVCAQVAQSPDQGTFQAAYLQDQQGQQQAPRDVDICRLYGQWRLSVGWTRSTYTNGALTSRETGGFTRQGQLSIPGVSPGSDAIWKRLGFSNASRGAQMARFRFTVPRQQMGPNRMGVVIHITRPGQDPVTTVPFAMIMREGPEGFTFERPGP